MPVKKASSRTIRPAVSVITVCRNAGRTIRRTIESVRAQTVPVAEYIVIDGASTDETIEIVRSFGRAVTTVISEPDQGVSDAFNKGLERATGEFIKILNADDWMAPDAIEQSLAALEASPGAGFAFGDLIEVDRATGRTSRIAGDPEYHRWIQRVMGRLNHPTALVRREVYDALGGYRREWRFAMDYEWFLRVHTNGVRGVYGSEIVVYMETGGMATSGRREAVREVRDISIRYGYPAVLAYGYYALRRLKHALLRGAGLR